MKIMVNRMNKEAKIVRFTILSNLAKVPYNTRFDITKRHILFIGIFIVLAVIADRINFSALVGAESQYFTLFQFFGPIAGGFLGPFIGPVAVLLSELINYFIAGKAFTLINVIRLLPMMFAAYYFGTLMKGGKLRKLNYFIPIVCMILFIMHPQGRGAWLYAMYWWIPIIANIPAVKKIVFMRSLGATFMAHAVGSAAWIYSTNMATGLWIGLIPVVIYERMLFAAGIAGSYIIINSVLDWLSNKVELKELLVDKRFVAGRYVGLFRV